RCRWHWDGADGWMQDLSRGNCHTGAPTARQDIELRQDGGGAKVIRRFAILAVALCAIAGSSLFADPASAQYVPGQPGCIPEPAQIDANTQTSGVLECIGCPPNVQANAFVLVDGEEVFIGSAQVSD